MEEWILKENLMTSIIVMNCAGYDVKYFRVRKAFLRRLKLSQKLVIANSLMEYNEQLYYNEKKSQKRLLRESYKN